MDKQANEAIEARNWLSNGDLLLGMVTWEARPSEQVLLDAAGPEGGPAARLERAPGPGEPVVWRQAVTGLPPRRQVRLTAQVRVAKGEAKLWIRCCRADGTEIDGHHTEPWFAPRAWATNTWQTLSCAFPLPAETCCVEVGGSIAHEGLAWFTDFTLHLVPDDAPFLRAAVHETLVRNSSHPGSALRGGALACRRAFSCVPRHLFLPGCTLAEAYVDAPVVTRYEDQVGQRVAISSSSQPSAMAVMLDQLRLRPGMRVLEIGAGTGYNAAIMAELVGAQNVVSVDLDPDIAAEARAHLDAAGYPEVEVAAAEGWDGFPARAPYDRIIVTVGVQDLAPAWVEQLSDGGVIVLPITFRGTQFTPAFRKRGRRLVTERISGCAFMDLRGKRPRRFRHHRDDHFVIHHDSLSEADLTALEEILALPPEPLEGSEAADPAAGAYGFFDFKMYLCLAHPLGMQLRAPCLTEYGIQDWTAAIADLDRRQLALVGANLCFGGAEIGLELRRLAQQWLEMGRPDLNRLRMAAYPRAAFPNPSLLPKRGWTGFVAKEHTWFTWRFLEAGDTRVRPGA
ncbi:MAG TPA: class I SAM-dependent methyltransferase [Candidatus Polarisedimenticolia bacterium]|nr:class I SAM-dependent methyltransferase [Candidatus Polarisedimenticolia bacterium]